MHTPNKAYSRFVYDAVSTWNAGRAEEGTWIQISEEEKERKDDHTRGTRMKRERERER